MEFIEHPDIERGTLLGTLKPYKKPVYTCDFPGCDTTDEDYCDYYLFDEGEVRICGNCVDDYVRSKKVIGVEDTDGICAYC